MGPRSVRIFPNLSAGPMPGCAPAHRQAAHRLVHASAGVAVTAFEAVEQAQGDVLLAVALEALSGHAAVDARRTWRLDPLLDLLDHVHGRPSVEPGDQVHRHRVVVLDRAGGGAAGHHADRQARQRERERLAAFVVVVVEHGHVDGLRRVAGGERDEHQRGPRDRGHPGRDRRAHASSPSMGV